MEKRRFEFKGVAEVADGDFDSVDVRMAVREGFDSSVSLVWVDVSPQRYSELRKEIKSITREIIAIAKPDDKGVQWAAYISVVPGKNHDEEYDIAFRDGRKLTKDEATHYFPQFDPAKYRK